MELKETLEGRLDDPEFCRALLEELRALIKENERMRQVIVNVRAQLKEACNEV